MPNDAARQLTRVAHRLRKVFDPLRVKVNLDVGLCGKALNLLGEAALGAMPAV
jgi:hypothetical protein